MPTQTGYLLISGVPDNSYTAYIYSSGFNLVSNPALDRYNGNTQVYSIQLTGIQNSQNDFDIFVRKGNWTAARISVVGVLDSGSYKLV